MEQADPVAQLYARAKINRISMAAVCREAGVATTTPSRWRNDRNGANLKTVDALNAALSRLIEALPQQAAA